MRPVFAFLVFAACTPEIAPGAYLCGPEQLCPEGLVCNGVDAVCVGPSKALPFECGEKNQDVPGDDVPATAQSLGELACVSPVRETRSCLPAGDVGDFYTFRVADGCTNVKVVAAVVYPVAFQSLVLQLAKPGEPPVTMDTPCAATRPAAEGNAQACLEAAVEPGSYTIGVVPDGTGHCDNACRYNRYGLGVLVMPQ